MGKQVFVTVGTSALSKFSSSSCDTVDDLIEELRQEAANKEDILYKNQKDLITQRLQQNLKSWTGNTRDRHADFFSAEISSLLAMKTKGLLASVGAENQIVLLYTDTIEGELCAEVLTKVIGEANGPGQLVGSADMVTMYKIEGLKVDKVVEFKQGLETLQKLIHTNVKTEHELFFNITGGYKALIPYTTFLAWDFAMTICYLFENTFELIQIKHPSSWVPRFSDAYDCTTGG